MDRASSVNCVVLLPINSLHVLRRISTAFQNWMATDRCCQVGAGRCSIETIHEKCLTSMQTRRMMHSNSCCLLLISIWPWDIFRDKHCRADTGR